VALEVQLLAVLVVLDLTLIQLGLVQQQQV
jgi:hypothetical protein